MKGTCRVIVVVSKDRWMDDMILHPFQQYFCHIRTVGE